MPGDFHHNAITREALSVLPDWANDRIGAAKSFLLDEACVLPDRYYDIHGSGHARAKPYALLIDGIQFHYLPNSPIEGEYKYWGVTHRGDGPRLERVVTEPNENWRHARIGFKYYMEQCVQRLRDNRPEDAMGFLGTLFHVLQDASTFLHSLEGPDGTDLFVLDRLLDPPDGAIAERPTAVLSGGTVDCHIGAYRPRLLGTGVGEAAFRLYTAYAETVLRSRKKLLPMLLKHYDQDETGANVLRAEILAHAARLCADTAYTILCIAVDHFDPEELAPLARVYLSDLKPVREPRGLSLPYRFVTMLRDAALTPDMQRTALALTIDGQRVAFAKGLGTGCHFDYTIAWEIPPDVYCAFSCGVGLHPDLSRNGAFLAEVRLNGTSLGQRPVTADAPATRFTTDARPGGLLEFHVESGGGMGGTTQSLNSIVWAEPVLEKWTRRATRSTSRAGVPPAPDQPGTADPLHRRSQTMPTTIIEATKIWDIPHSDFAESEYHRRLRDEPLSGMGEIHPDLVRFKGHFYCCFGEPCDPDPVFCEASGNLRIIRSPDGVTWETVSLGTVGRRFSVTSGNQLMLNKYHWIPPREDETTRTRSPHELGSGNKQKPIRESVTYLTADGVAWSDAHNNEGYNTFRWDVTWHKGYGYCLAYCGNDFAGTLYRTPNGITWEVVARQVFPAAHRGGYEEATLAFDPVDDSICAVVRAKPVYAIMGRAAAPRYDDWSWSNAQVDLEGDGTLRPACETLGPQMGGPKLMRLHDGRLMLAGKADASTPAANLGRNEFYWPDFGRNVLTRFAQFDGYMHYPGIVEHEGVLWMTCGKRGPFEVWMLKVALPAMT